MIAPIDGWVSDRPGHLEVNGQHLCLLAIHAHPDDESSKGSGVAAKYADEGIRTVLVTCTGGEAGEILNPAMDQPGMLDRMPEVRREELQEATRILSYSAVYLLGYHDSGMPNTDWNALPNNFHNAPMDEAVAKLVEIIRREKPQVVITYSDDRPRGDDDRPRYGHPDHVKVHEVSGPAFEAAADPEYRPALGEPWQVSKVYYTGWSPRRQQALEQLYDELGIERPQRGPGIRPRRTPEDWEDRFTTLVDVGEYMEHRKQALLAHRTQIDPNGQWFRLPDDAVKRVFPWEEFMLARSLVPTETPENDLFAGIR